MSRAVLTILVALPMLMPQGVCLRKFDWMGWPHRTTATPTSHVRIERAEDRHPSGCQCGCQERAARSEATVEKGCDPAGDLRVHDGTPPQPQEPCCPAICKSKLDKIVQGGNPQPCGAVAFVGFAPAPMTHTRTATQYRLPVVSNAPPLYVSFCTFLI